MSFLTAGSKAGPILSLSGDLRSTANVTTCGASCTLGPGNSDGDYAQWAVFVVSFNIPTPETVQIVTFSYGGGANGTGTLISQGGLEPYLSLFDAVGSFLASTYFGITCPSVANTNSSSGQCYDVLLDAGSLPAGSYQVAISAYANMSLAENAGTGTLGDGFTGLGNLFPGEDLHYAFDIDLGAASPLAPAPEPDAFGLVAVAAVAFLGIKKGKRS
ncbi:MAG: DVUA0089 family protein [Acidobacteriia bacterium]|nr:DVUA0089 family protein [Terriglobia bacterium]